jgi:hypothetical protein
MDRKSVREVKFLTGYASGFPLHDEPFLVKGAIFSNNTFQICVRVHICPLTSSVTHQILNIFLVSVHSMKLSSELPVILIIGLTLCVGFILNTECSHSLIYVWIVFHRALRESYFM